MDSSSVGSNEIVTEQTSHTFTKMHNFRNDVRFDSSGGILFDVSDKALEFGDKYKATFGAGADLAIFHDGGNSAIIDQGTGGLFIRGSSINIDDTSSNDYITGTEGGAVTLFHNGSSKLATTSTGVTITGNPYIIGDQMVFEGATPNSHELFIQITDPTDDRTITLPDASGTVLLNSGDQTITGDLTLTATDDTSNSTPELKLVRHSSSPADYDYIGGLSFLADNSTDSNIEYGTIEARIRDVTKDTEDFAGFELFGVKNGTARQRFMILGQEIFHLMNRQTIKFDDITGTDDLTIAPPSSLSASQTITLPDATGTVILNTGGTFTGDVSVTGKITSSDSAIFDGNGSSGGVSISDGLIDIRTGTGLVSKIKFYCESSNAHFQTLQAAPHSEASSAVIVLPTASGTLLNENGSAANLTQIPMAQASGTLAAANVGNLPASKITSGVFDSARLPAGAFASGGGGGGEANQNAFSTISVAGQSDVVADAATDTVTFVAGSNMTITTNASGDTVTFASSGGGGGGGGGLDSADVLTVTGTASITGVSGDLTVAGALSATTKSFDIEHPTENGKRLRYGSLEGPENGVYVRGRIKGINKIKLPDYWTGLVDEETITVNITPIGSEQCLFVEDIQSGEVIIGGGQDIACFYTVYGERKDVEKLEVEY